MKLFALIWILTLGLAGCSSPKLSVSSVNYLSIINNNDLAIDSGVLNTITPYKTQLDRLMGDTLAYLKTTIKKSGLNMPLGTWMAATCLEWSKQAGYDADMALFNQGGIRLPELPAGFVSRGKIYELMPFDNELVVLTLHADTLASLLKKLELKGGEPAFGLKCLSGSYSVQNLPLSEVKWVKVLTSDFLWKGGDKFTQLADAVEVKQSGVLIRDALINQMLKNDTCYFEQEKGVWCVN